MLPSAVGSFVCCFIAQQPRILLARCSFGKADVNSATCKTEWDLKADGKERHWSTRGQKALHPMELPYMTEISLHTTPVLWKLRYNSLSSTARLGTTEEGNQLHGHPPCSYRATKYGLLFRHFLIVCIYVQVCSFDVG